MKGEFNQECNRTACNNQNAVYYNLSTEKYYCRSCATEINYWNRADAMRLYGHDLCMKRVDMGSPNSFNPDDFKEL